MIDAIRGLVYTPAHPATINGISRRSGPPFFMALHPQESSLAPPAIEGAPGLAVFETWDASFSLDVRTRNRL